MACGLAGARELADTPASFSELLLAHDVSSELAAADSLADSLAAQLEERSYDRDALGLWQSNAAAIEPLLPAPVSEMGALDDLAQVEDHSGSKNGLGDVLHMGQRHGGWLGWHHDSGFGWPHCGYLCGGDGGDGWGHPVSGIPEPATWQLAVLGIAALLLAARLRLRLKRNAG